MLLLVNPLISILDISTHINCEFVVLVLYFLACLTSVQFTRVHHWKELSGLIKGYVACCNSCKLVYTIEWIWCEQILNVIISLILYSLVHTGLYLIIVVNLSLCIAVLPCIMNDNIIIVTVPFLLLKTKVCDIAVNWAGGLHHAKKCEVCSHLLSHTSIINSFYSWIQ